ncbi:MAG: nitroreductase family protein [Candidatus Helarchaeota archaeon]
MDLMDCIMTRRSIRKYSKTEVKPEILKKILNAAIMAPSAHNSNPWHFIIIYDRELRRNLAVEMAKKYENDLIRDNVNSGIIQQLINTSIERFTNAPVLIVPCLDMNRMQKYPDEVRQQIEHQMGVQSVSAAIQNLLLAAHNVGLASCWYCAPLFAQNIVKKILKIPKHIEPQAFITIGYPLDKISVSPPRRLELEKVCHLNIWGEKF